MARLVLTMAMVGLIAAGVFWARSQEIEDRWVWNHTPSRQVRLASVDGRLVLMSWNGAGVWRDGHSSFRFDEQYVGGYDKGRHLLGFVHYNGTSPASLSATPGTVAFWGVPYGFIVLVLAIIAVLTWRRLRTAERFWSRGRCPVCGYDIRVSSERCPECGGDVGPYSMWNPWDDD